jgi:glucokinase
MRTVGIDLGGTKVMAVLVENGEVLAKAKQPTPVTGGPDAVITAMVAAAREVDPGGTAVGVGIGAPGPVVPGSGVLPAAPNLPGWDHDVDVVGRMSAALDGRPVKLDNDVNVGTLAEWKLGAGRGVDDLLGVFAGTGVGAGLVLDGRLRQGPRGLAGEIGHTFVAFDQFREAPVGRGELEDFAGRRSLQRWVEVAPHAESALMRRLMGRGRLKSKAWADGVEAKDPLTLRLVNRASSALSAAIASAITLVDVERVVLGGGFAERLGEPFRERVEAEVAERAFAGQTAPVVAARLGDTGGAVGAALLLEHT